MVILVEPIYFFFRHHFANNGASVDGTEREGFKLQEGATFGLESRNHKECVFDSDAETVFEINARFVGHSHSFAERLRHIFHPNLMRSFMDIEKTSHSVSCAMQEVVSVLPEVATCHSVELCSACSFGEYEHLQLYEQKLLRLLVENRGRTMTRGNLVDRIWTDGAEYVDENALSVTIKRLRDKLGAQKYIKTIYGIGYSWVTKDE